MKKRLLLTILLLLISLLLGLFTLCHLQNFTFSGSFIENSRNVSYLQNSVVALVRKDKDERILATHCSAFFISPTKIATALHCVELPNAKTLLMAPGVYIQATDNLEADSTIGREILFVNFKTHNEIGSDILFSQDVGKANVISIDDKNDLAILELSKEEEPSPSWLKMADRSSVGEKVFSLGMPMGTPWILTQGIISATMIHGDDIFRIYHQAPISPGSSGSPLLNNKGEIVGVTIQYVKELRYLGIASGYNNLKELAEIGHQEAEVININLALPVIDPMLNPEMYVEDNCDPKITSCPK